MNILIRIKKMCGRLGRKYGGRPFQVVRKFIYDSHRNLSRFIPETRAIIGIYRKSFGDRNSEDARFYAPYIGVLPKADLTKKGIICMYDGLILHGGLTDRERGLLTTYKEVRRRGIPFYIHWNHPFELTDYLQPATFDWRIDPEEISYSAEDSFPVLIQDHRKVINRLRLTGALYKCRKQTLVYSNSDNGRGCYAELYKELFRPTERLEKAVKIHSGQLGEHYWAFSFRFIGLLGDFKDLPDYILPEEERKRFLSKVVAEFRKLLNLVPDGHKVLVATDSPEFLKLAPSIDSRVYVVDGDIRHLDISESKNEDVWLKTFVDQHLLMHAEKVILMRTGSMFRSGFPRFAAEVGGAEFIDHKF